MIRIFAILLLIFSFVTPTVAQAPTLEGLEWMTGHWEWLRDDGITVEVNWAPALGATKVGTLQQRMGEKIMAFETLEMTAMSDEITYTFDLFLRDEQFENPHSSHLMLVSLKGEKAVFEGKFFEDNSIIRLTIELLDTGELHSWFVFKDEDDVFSFTRYRAHPMPVESEEATPNPTQE